jgi:hypothetical protein
LAWYGRRRWTRKLASRMEIQRPAVVWVIPQSFLEDRFEGSPDHAD